MNNNKLLFSSSQGRLTFRTAGEKDASSMLSRLRDHQNVQFLPSLNSSKQTNESSQDWMHRCMTEPSSLFLVIALNETDEIIGGGGFNKIDLKNGYGEAGMIIDNIPKVREKGFGVEAMDALIRYGFETMQLGTIVVKTLKTNEAMVGLMGTKFGLKPDMIFVEQGIECVFTIEKKNYKGPI